MNVKIIQAHTMLASNLSATLYASYCHVPYYFLQRKTNLIKIITDIAVHM